MISRLAAASALAIGLVSRGGLAQESGSGNQATPSTHDPGSQAQPTDQTSHQGSHGSQGAPQSNQTQEGTLSAADRRFFDAAAHANDQEIKLGELAKSKGQSDDVKRFGQRLVDDHTSANESLKALAQKKGITLAAPPCPGEPSQSADPRLSKLSSERFDKEYLSQVMQDHLKAVADFQHAARDASDPDLKDYAQDTLPVLLEHERLVNDIRSDLSAPASPGSQPTKGGTPAAQGGAQTPQGGSQTPQGGSQTPQGGSQNPDGAQTPQAPQRKPGGPQGAGKAPSSPTTPSSPTAPSSPSSGGSPGGTGR